ncbi:MAG TPA: hypothetical protein VGI45_07795 [Terracidiphilus sp.]
MNILDTALQFTGFIIEAVIAGLVLYRRIYKTLPLFSCYLVWSLISDLGGFLLIRRFPASGLNIYLTSAIIDAIFMLCVLVEVSMSVLKPIRAWLSRWAFLAVTMVIALCGLAVWHFIKFPGFEHLRAEHEYQIIAHLQLTVSAVRILFFLVLASLSQLLSIGWRDREFQIATGFGFYSIVSLSVALLHLNLGAGTPELNHQYALLDAAVGASYACSIFYWIVCFAQNVPERREFTPQMQNFLLAVAGNARATRIAMASSSKESDRPIRR